MISPAPKANMAGRHSSASSELENYKRRRHEFFARCCSVWPDSLLHPYDLLDLYCIPRAEVAAITECAEALARLYERTASLLRTVPDDTLLQMGLSEPALTFSRNQTPGMPDSVIGRFDLVKTASGYKMLEFNAEAPGLLIETFAINGLVCDEAGKIDPNRSSAPELAAAFKNAIRGGLDYIGKTEGEQAQFVFSSSEEFAREIAGARYLIGLLDLPDNVQKQCLDIDSLCADETGLYDSEGRRIDVWYRIHPLHYFRGGMFRDKANKDASKHDGRLLFHLMQQRRIALINPPSAYLLQSKAVQVVIWGLYEAGIYFDDEERDAIERYMLPTYMDPPEDEQYVIKPVYGGEGDTVEIVNRANGTVLRSSSRSHVEQPMVYQKFVELPLIEAMTEEGTRSLRVVTSCFLVGGQPGGITMRAGSGITDSSWWFLPVGVAD